MTSRTGNRPQDRGPIKRERRGASHERLPLGDRDGSAGRNWKERRDKKIKF